MTSHAESHGIPRQFWAPLLCLAPLLAPGGCRSPSGPPAPAFTDVSATAGIDFIHDNGAYGQKFYPERMGSGAAFIDANGDGLLDVFLVNGSPLPGHPHPKPRPSRLYLNAGNGAFRDATSASGLDSPGYGMGVAVGDMNNDGNEDLYLTRVGRNSLYLGLGNGKFRDVAAAAGVGGSGFSTSAAFLDFDGDGLLDLYVCRYVPWTRPEHDYLCRNPEGEKTYCTVHVYPGMEHLLFRNLGDARFRDVSREGGILGPKGRGLAVVCGDYDRDGDTDIFVANDETPNFLWRNEGGRFTERGAETGFAYNEYGRATAGMGLDIADADGDSFDDVIESDFHGQRKTLYLNDGSGFFVPNAGGKGLGDMTLDRLGFGIGFLDFDLDTWPDVFIANGHVNDDLERSTPPVSYAQLAQLFRNEGQGQYRDVSSLLGAYGRTPLVGRGVAFGDYDNDGDLDILVANNAGKAVLLRNDTARLNHWIGVRCVGRAGRTAFGTRVSVTARGRVQSLEVRTARSYLSASDPRLLFGLGSNRQVERLTVTWPDGSSGSWARPQVDRYYTARQDTGRLLQVDGGEPQ